MGQWFPNDNEKSSYFKGYQPWYSQFFKLPENMRQQSTLDKQIEEAERQLRYNEFLAWD